jgi:hypothetical protein
MSSIGNDEWIIVSAASGEKLVYFVRTPEHTLLMDKVDFGIYFNQIVNPCEWWGLGSINYAPGSSMIMKKTGDSDLPWELHFNVISNDPESSQACFIKMTEKEAEEVLGIFQNAATFFSPPPNE